MVKIVQNKNQMKNIKSFVFDGMLVSDTLKDLHKEGINVLGFEEVAVSRVVESDFSPKLWYKAKKMSSVYMALFCIENMMRDFISERLAERNGIDWWDNNVPKKVKEDVGKLKVSEEKNKYYSGRSDANIGYTMLGNLTQIVVNNWEEFSDIIPNQAWLSSRMDDLEKSRNIIMHTGYLPDIEIERIESIVRDLLNQLG